MISAEEMRLHLRVTGEAMDSEISLLIEAALADMRRVGIDFEKAEYSEPLANMAVVCFCKSRFGFDNPDSPMYEQLYRQYVTDLLNSKANEADSQ